MLVVAERIHIDEKFECVHCGLAVDGYILVNIISGEAFEQVLRFVETGLGHILPSIGHHVEVEGHTESGHECRACPHFKILCYRQCQLHADTGGAEGETHIEVV